MECDADRVGSQMEVGNAKTAFSEAKPHPLARAASRLGVAFTNNDENNEKPPSPPIPNEQTRVRANNSCEDR